MGILSEMPAAAGTRAPVINLFYVRDPRSQTQLRSIPDFKRPIIEKMIPHRVCYPGLSVTHSVLARPAARRGLHAYSGRRHLLLLFSQATNHALGMGWRGMGALPSFPLKQTAFAFRSSFSLRPRNRLPMNVAPQNTCRRTGTNHCDQPTKKSQHTKKKRRG